MTRKAVFSGWLLLMLSCGLPAAKAPVLGRPDRLLLPADILDAVISPSHKVSEDYEGKLEPGELSPMSDLTHVMTVRELLDITAYLMAQQD
ncbi:MAG: hypothetical protein Q8R76_00320 [Candidatus Omnitrophota bacterium]|nr:hypothetical protein [Candidatus Omnitrophota bacterium]